MQAYETAKNDRFDEIVGLLDLFDGKLTLDDLLGQDIPVLNKLKEAKLRSIDRLNRERQKKTEQMAKNKK